VIAEGRESLAQQREMGMAGMVLDKVKAGCFDSGCGLGHLVYSGLDIFGAEIVKGLFPFWQSLIRTLRQTLLDSLYTSVDR
jgi:hypothetical protein